MLSCAGTLTGTAADELAAEDYRPVGVGRHGFGRREDRRARGCGADVGGSSMRPMRRAGAVSVGLIGVVVRDRERNEGGWVARCAT